MHKLEDELNKVWIGSYKIRANVERFSRDEPKNLTKEAEPKEKRSKRAMKLSISYAGT
ncbi:hypothetical protein Ancab_029613, partial [Ancistrocladus abbreviatus]